MKGAFAAWAVERNFSMRRLSGEWDETWDNRNHHQHVEMNVTACWRFKNVLLLWWWSRRVRTSFRWFTSHISAAFRPGSATLTLSTATSNFCLLSPKIHHPKHQHNMARPNICYKLDCSHLLFEFSSFQKLVVPGDAQVDWTNVLIYTWNSVLKRRHKHLFCLLE